MTAVWFIIAAAGASTARFVIARRLNRPGLPVGTLIVNVTGSFALGVLGSASSTTVTVVGVGLIGSFTTFSALMGEVGILADEYNPPRAAGYLGLTLFLGLIGAATGLHLGD